ncbi:hypothetical protein SCHIN_v1c05430 [Spiroplasma chinense]|uniref:Uncharacterized protein n=1 Tax=Spiroplasma chinense TaxID=216932 RepID=A0A5B9Y455_9MOLU|nr:hypothetical protein [Spiroplasma chinense]QEH61740.1 hypothetical protein SCHIN_v1c05430 [Spiroplasma chinense]
MEKENMWLEFNKQRTDFWISSLFILIESLAPGIAIWILVGNDVSISLKNNLPTPIVGYVALILFGYFIFTFLTTTIFYFLKFHKSDNFTYSLTFTMIISFLILIGFAFPNTTIYVLIKFVLALVVGIVSLTFSVFITFLVRNQELKRKENFEIEYEAWKKGEPIPLKKEIKMKRHQDYLEKQKVIAEELEKFKIELEKNIEEKYIIEKQKDLEKVKAINEKLDKKEQKKREKKNRIKF